MFSSSGTWWMWVGFLAFVAIVLAIDIFLLGKNQSHKVSIREASGWMLIWVSCALIFNGLLWWYLNYQRGGIYANEKALEFFSGYLIELSLSVDNMFAFIVIFNFFLVPMEYQRRVLIYGVISAIVMRFMVILGGTWLVDEFHWVLYVFGVFLIMTGINMLMPAKKNKDLSKNAVLRFLKRYVRISDRFHGRDFFVKLNKLWYATPLFLVLILVEMSDLVFALDSIPAVFSITTDAYIVFTSNIFAILGLRAMYFLLADLAQNFYLLKYGIAIMLTFIGIKMMMAYWIEIPILYALSVVVLILVTTVVLSVLFPKRMKS